VDGLKAKINGKAVHVEQDVQSHLDRVHGCSSRHQRVGRREEGCHQRQDRRMEGETRTDQVAGSRRQGRTVCRGRLSSRGRRPR
jgi:hypothetical protein